MRILVVGAGAIGGYFGGRLLQAHRDVFDAQAPSSTSTTFTACPLMNGTRRSPSVLAG